LPLLRKIVVFDMEGLRGWTIRRDQPGQAARAGPRIQRSSTPMRTDAARAACRPEDLAILVYTSGTTGKPKGAMHTHGPGLHRARLQHPDLASEADECMCFLPLCHIAERMGGEYFSLYTGAKLNFVENPDTVPENVREIAPTVFTAVPRVWEKFYSGVMIALKEASGCSSAVYAWAIGVGTRIADRCWPAPGGRRLKAQFTLARWLALNNVRKLIGIHRARFLVTGAAPISPELVQVVPGAGRAHARGLGHDRDLRRLHRRAGQRASSPARSARRPTSTRCASTRPPARILVRGPNVFMGLPEPAREDRRDHRRRRLAAHRRCGH
jgi:long-chain acyl-CoA synthetase